MRKRFVYIVLVPALLVAIILALFIDQWVESGLEYAGERIVQARVEIDGLDLSMFPIGMSVDRLQVTDPSDTWSNLFETGRIRFQMDAGQLLRAKFIIDTMSIQGFILGTRRSTDGKLEQAPPPPAGQAAPAGPSFTEQAVDVLKPAENSAPVFDLGRLRAQLNLDSLTNPANLETYRLIDSLDRQLKAAEAEWNTTLADVQSTRDRVTTIESQVRSIDVGTINSVESAQKAFNDAKQAYEATRDVVRVVDQRKASLTQSVNAFSSNIRTIDDAAKRDFERVVAAAKLPDVSMKGLAALVLGKEILDRAYEYLGYVDLARKTIPKYTPKPDPDQPKRSEGVTVHFPEESSYPKFWIKSIVLSGGTDSTQDPNYFYASGAIRNITNDQRLTHQPLTVDLRAQKAASTRATIEASFDRREDIPHDRYLVDVSGIPAGDMPLGSSSFLPSKISDGIIRATISVDVPGSSLESSAKVAFSSLRVVFDREPSGAVERLTRDVLAGIRGFFVNLRLWKKDNGALDIAFETDLDDQLSSRARSVVGAEIARLRNEIRQRVDAQIAAKRREIEALYTKKRQEVQAKLASLEQEVKSKVAFIEGKKKELEDRIEQEKKRTEDALKKKAGDALKGLLRKND